MPSISGPRRPQRPRLISVVIPTLDVVRTLPAQLDALRRQDYDGSWELVVADNGSRDGTVALAHSALDSFPGARFVDASAIRGASYARNAGAAQARGDFLAFTDGDDVAAEGWLSALALVAQNADLVAGGIETDTLSDELVRSWHPISPRERALQSFRFLPYASGTNIGIWADSFRRIGGFDERVRFGEDIELSWRAQLNSCTFALAPDAVVHYRLRERPTSALRQHHQYGTAGPLLYRRFREAGMPRPSVAEAIGRWARLALALPIAAWSPRGWGQWCVEGGLLAGRLTGSVRHRALYV